MVKTTFKKIRQQARKNHTDSSVRTVTFEIKPNDELIASLASSYENQRARQVSEWEILRRKGFQSGIRL